MFSDGANMSQLNEVIGYVIFTLARHLSRMLVKLDEEGKQYQTTTPAKTLDNTVNCIHWRHEM
jgi:hypothetical protein